MKLSQIKLSGFKSFVDNTTIEIKGNLVGIVGPNGCGKSNVIDAVRWVLGESSAKQLRGESMQDVIFNGSTKRKPISRASVELVFDNTDKIISGLWSNYDEISIKRLLTRSGESNYYINNQVVRRRDITELFLGTGVGAKGYAVIEQGMISRVIEAKPEDLRFYLEEAAGVSKYREKRKETLSKMNDTKDNLVRIEDIRCEIDKQITSLTHQAQTARKYQELHLELNNLQFLSLQLKINKAKWLLDEINQNITNVDGELNKLMINLANQDEHLTTYLLDKTIKEDKLNEYTSKFNSLRTNLARLEERKQYNQNLKERLTEQINTLNQELININEQIAGNLSESSNAHTTIALNNQVIEERQFAREEKSFVFEEAENKLIQAKDVISELINNATQIKHETDLVRNSIEHKKNQLNGLKTRVKKLEQEKTENILDFNEKYVITKDEISELSIELEHIETELTKSQQLKNELSLSIKENTQIYHEYNTKISALVSQLSLVKELLQKQVLSDESLHEFITKEETLAPLWSSITVLNGYELAVETALGYLLKATHVKDINTITSYPKSMWAVWSEVLSSNKSKVYSADELIEYETLDKYVTIKGDGFNNIHRILCKYIICDNYANATKIKQAIQQKNDGGIDEYTIVTKDGHLITNNYVIFNANISDTHVLEYQNKIYNLENELEILQVKFHKLENTLQRHNLELTKYEHNVVRLDELYNTNFKKKHDLQIELTKEEQIFIQNKQHQEKVLQELALLTQEIDYVQNEILEMQIKLEDGELELSYLSEKQQLAELNKIEVETAFNLIKSSIQVIDAEINQRVIDNQILKQKLLNFESTTLDKNSSIETIKQKINDLETERTNLFEDDNTLELGVIQEEIQDVALHIEEQTNEINRLNDSITITRDNLAKISKQKEALGSKLSQLMLKQQEQVVLLQTYNDATEEFKQSSNYNSEAFDRNTETKDCLSDIQDKITNLQAQITQLGLVNLKAIEDLDEATAKHTELVAQVLDLNNAINSLDLAIKQIDTKTRDLLNTTYNKVCEVFDVYFKTLFGGGGAKLELTEKDILQAGVQIFAQPPGKKNSSIHLLSGGEKALTAMSLVFAFFNLNPAPFCLLDEVDAPLDDANTTRFCDLVAKLSAKTQFVYISHNRLTMEMAEQLIGVTMQEKGISTTVSVNLVDAVKHAI